jgi:biotin carboxyl carrier protein
MERKFRITVNDRQYIVTVEDISEGENLLFPEPGSMQIPVPVPPPRPKAPVTQAAEPGAELSPLAGIVQAVEVSVGQAVKGGDKLLTLEAMKMTTTVFAHHTGKVTRLTVKPGDAVEAGQVLLTIA